MWVDPVSAEKDREFRYRRLFPMTHEQYLDEPIETIEWMLRIEAIYPRQQGESDAGPRPS